MSKKELQSTLVNRREALSLFAGLVSGILIFLGFGDVALGQRGVVRRTRRRVRRRVRRRIRRRATFRIVRGRRVWVAPVALAVGWELALNNRVVVVKETKFVERDGAKVEVAVVQDADGKTEEIEIVRENTTENSENLQGSVLSDDDKTTPAVENEEEVEVEE